MCRLLESIYVCDGKFRNLHVHQARITNSAQVLFRQPLKWTLESILMKANIPTSGLFKARLVYDQEFVNVEFIPYQVKPVASLKLVEADFQYAHKFVNRELLDEVFGKREMCDDVIIVQNGFITDATYANLIFKKDNKWFTPTTCLLPGTMRTYLLMEKKISEAKIQVDNLNQYESCKLINALLGWDAPEIPVTAIR
ncbi:MAG: aminotransferase class IV [Cyclobacteriaceae bacterium]|nr:aminotransferase class IV [Cyclobacteriaceae bacterium]